MALILAEGTGLDSRPQRIDSEHAEQRHGLGGHQEITVFSDERLAVAAREPLTDLFGAAPAAI
jgi:hypothetical protein